MIHTVLIDTRWFSRGDSEWRDTIIQECRKQDLNVFEQHVEHKRDFHDEDLVSIVGMGASVAGLVLALLPLLKEPAESWTYAGLLNELRAFLDLKGYKEYSIDDISGFENLVNANRKPCIVSVTAENGRSLRVYIGLTEEMLVISSHDYNQKSLLP